MLRRRAPAAPLKATGRSAVRAGALAGWCSSLYSPSAGPAAVDAFDQVEPNAQGCSKSKARATAGTFDPAGGLPASSVAMGGARATALAAAVLLLTAAPATAADTWYPGDLHVHTCYSHDAYCGPADDNTGPDTFYSSGGTVMERFLESSGKGLAFLAITDHDDVRAQSDPDYGTHGVAPIAAYETSLAGGHAQMLGATPAYDRGTGDAASTNAMADALRADGGVFQANHPSYRQGSPVTSCAEVAAKDTPMHWKYGFDVQPDTIEVWNSTSLIPPSELFWECWLQRGARIGMTGGSDTHGATQPWIGFPTTWVRAASTKQPDLLAALRAGRTTVSRLPARQGGVRLLLEADRNRDGSYESGIGDQVPPGTPMRVRADDLPGRGLVRVRANGTTYKEADLQPGGAGRPACGAGVRCASGQAAPPTRRRTFSPAERSTSTRPRRPSAGSGPRSIPTTAGRASAPPAARASRQATPSTCARRTWRPQ